MLLPRPELVDLPLRHEAGRGEDEPRGEREEEREAGDERSGARRSRADRRQGAGKEQDENAGERQQRGSDDGVEVGRATDPELEESVALREFKVLGRGHGHGPCGGRGRLGSRLFRHGRGSRGWGSRVT